MWQPLQNVLEFVKKGIDKMLATNENPIVSALRQQVGFTYNMSAEMQNALIQWSAMYHGRAQYLVENSDMKSMNLGRAISSEIASTATIEMKVTVTGSPRADYLQERVEEILEDIRQNVELGNAKGGLIFKPYVDSNGEMCMDYAQSDMFYPLTFDSNKNLTGAAFFYWKRQGNYWFTRIEAHQMLENNTYRIVNLVFKSDNPFNSYGFGSQFGTFAQVSLSYVPEWAQLQEITTLENIEEPLFGYFRVPQANAIDSRSPLSVSCFSGAVDPIKQADILYTNLLWEFESGQRRLYVDKSAFNQVTDQDKEGNWRIPDKKLFRVLNVDSASITEPGFFKEWSPAFREAAIQSGLNSVLRTIEFNCGMSYGVISDARDQALTATEVKASKQRYYVTITDTQKKIKNALQEAIEAMDTYATLYGLAPQGDYEVSFSFDDSVVSDRDTQFDQDKLIVDGGGMSWVEFRMRNYGESKEVAMQAVAEAQAERQPDIIRETVNAATANSTTPATAPNNQPAPAMPMQGAMNGMSE